MNTNWWSGNKTFVGSVLAGIVGMAYFNKWIDLTPEMWGTIASVIGTFTTVSMRLGMKKAEAPK